MILPKVAKIAVEQAAFSFDKLYDYYVPDSLGELKCGSRVLVPFGGGNRKRQGIVVQINAVPDVSKLKPVFSVLDKEPLISKEMIDLAIWIKERTFCTLFEAVRIMLPTGLYMRIKIIYKAAQSNTKQIEQLSEQEHALYSIVAEHPDGIDKDKLANKIDLTIDDQLPERLVRMGVLVRSDNAFRRLGDSTIRMVRLCNLGEQFEDILSSCTQKQKKVIDLLKDVGSASVKEIEYYCSVTAVVINALEKKGLAECYQNEQLRNPLINTDCPEIESSVLSEQQQDAFKGLLALYKSGKPSAALLYGVTGSGKTQVYMNIIDRVIEDGRHAMVLVPEISLTPQLLSIFIKRYGNRVAVLHSGLSMGERMDEWKRIRRGDAQITVGTRSAVFAPVHNLGLIIMDEEQENTYKSESSPRYHTRDIARWRCTHHNALLLLTSATPSIESFHAAKTGRYSFFELPSRYGQAKLPEVEIVDMRQQTPAITGGIISQRLKQQMEETIEQKQQVILLLNRRGYHTFVSCRSCGNVITCPSCSISLNFHRANGRLMCHYCGHTEQPVGECPECASDKIRYSGLGTQRVEQELEEIFPDMSILRMDTDATMSRFSYEEKFKSFGQGKYNIMIGTQMVAKGLDFPNVGLVGVLCADQSLYSGDFRSFELTFALLTQVVGRAGRRDIKGKALVQTFTPYNFVIELASKQDYNSFFEYEISARKMMSYPPYADLCLFGFSGVEQQAVKQAAFGFLSMLREYAMGEYKHLPMIVLDPTPSSISRIAGKFRYKILMKTRFNAEMRMLIGKLITDFARKPQNKTVTVFADVNPLGNI